MILRPVRPVSPLGPPIVNAPVGFTCRIVSVVHHPGGQEREEVLAHVLLDLVPRDPFVVLRGDHHGVDAPRAVVVAVLHRDLALAVGAQVRERPVLA